DRAVAERHRPRLRPEPRAVARGAAGARHVALEVRGPRDAPEVLHRRDEARDRLQVLALHLLAAGRLVLPLEEELLLAGAVQEHALLLLRQRAPRLVEREPEEPRHLLERLGTEPRV